METHELLFELSHPIRYDIMRLLSENPLRLTKIGEQVDANNPEVSRHLDRLKNAELVAKNPDGSYAATPFGRLIFAMLPGLSFIADHSGYFLDHDLSKLPVEFLARLGELTDCSYGEGTITNMGISNQIVMEAGDYVHFVTREVPRDTSNYHALGNKGIEIRLIREDDGCIGCERDDCAACYDRQRLVPELPAIMVLTERQAGLMFPNLKGQFDFAAGFSSSDPAFLRWCGDLFDHLWDTGVTGPLAGGTGGEVDPGDRSEG
jgi:predicted transcriptional regulator